MSAQINTIDQLLAATRAAKEEHKQSEAQQAQAADAAAKHVLNTYINQTLADVLRLLNLKREHFIMTRTRSGWMAEVSWAQKIGDQMYMLEMHVTTGQAIILGKANAYTVSYMYLKPGPQDPVEVLGQFLLEYPDSWDKYMGREGDKALQNLTTRLNRSTDIDALLAIAAAADEEEFLRPEDRAGLRAKIAKEIRNIRDEERRERNDRNARLIYAVEIIELAQAYVEEYAWYELSCYAWATEWTRKLWAPCELYKVRYVPITADGNTEHCIQELVVVDHPSTMDMGDWNSVVTEVTSHGQIGKRWIGAFLDAKPIRWDKPLISDRYMYHTAIRAGDYYVNIPPADLVPVDTAAVEAARPEPPALWIDWLHEKYDGAGQLDVPITDGHYTPVPVSPFDVARMTPVEFVDSPKFSF